MNNLQIKWSRSLAHAAAKLSLITAVLLGDQLAGVDAQEPADEPQVRVPAPETGKRSGSVKRSRRLPPFYARVVNTGQRQAIYGIQDKYQLRIDALEEQIAAIRGQMTTEIDKLLTPEQVKALASLKQQARRVPQVLAKPVEPRPETSVPAPAKP